VSLCPIATEDSLHAGEWDQVAVAAKQPLPAAPGDVKGSAPKALFHLLDKTILLKHLRELKAEKTINRKCFHMSYTKW
jgi:hypothetical protein